MSSVNGWDERDYRLWSAVRSLPSFGLIAGDDHMVSSEQVLQLLRDAAEERFNKSRKLGGE